MNRLNLGSGLVTPEGWTNIDLVEGPNTVVANVLEGLPFPENHFDYIVANHTLQMIRFHDLPKALAEIRRVLKGGGVLRIITPDVYRAVAKWRAGDRAYFPIADELEGNLDAKFLRYLFWHGDTRSAFTASSLATLLNDNGFQNVQRCQFNQTFSDYPEITSLDSRAGESLIIECIR